MISRASGPTSVTYDSVDSGSTIIEQSFITLNARPATGSPTPWCFFFLAISTRRHGDHRAYTEESAFSDRLLKQGVNEKRSVSGLTLRPATQLANCFTVRISRWLHGRNIRLFASGRLVARGVRSDCESGFTFAGRGSRSCRGNSYAMQRQDRPTRRRQIRD